MQIFATGIGQLLDFQELAIIASTNPSTNKSLIYHVDDFDDLHLNSLEQILADVICGVDIPSTTTITTIVSTAILATAESCADKVTNCDEYDENMCTSYHPWAQAHCERYCGFCQGPTTTPTPCVDTIGNCREYGHDICTSTSFRKWTKEHCARFCEFCGVDILTAPQVTSTTPKYTATIVTSLKSAVSTTAQSPPLKSTCSDKIKNCGEYGLDICTDYAPWATEHCKMYCGFCRGPTTTPKPCVDSIGNCNEYPPDICTAVSFIKWTKDHCARFCNICDATSP